VLTGFTTFVRLRQRKGARAHLPLAFPAGWVKLPLLRLPQLKRLGSRRGALALGGGVCWALAFPTPGWAGLAWVAPGAMLLAALGAPPARAFRLGYLAGLVFALISLRWLLHIPFPAGAVAGWLALSAYLALYPAAWVWLCGRVWRALSAPAQTVTPSLSPDTNDAAGADAGGGDATRLTREADRLRRLLCPLLAVSSSRCVLWAFTCAAAWAALETVQGRFLSGFPWNFLGVSQYQGLPLIQIASITGVYGVSFLVAWFSASLLLAALRLGSRPLRAPGASAMRPGGAGAGTLPFRVCFDPSVLAVLAAPTLVLAGVVAFGVGKLSASFARDATPISTPTNRPTAGNQGAGDRGRDGGASRTQPDAVGSQVRKLKIALVQPSIPQRLIFDPKETARRFDTLMELSRLALGTHPDLLVWPEASLPGLDLTNYQAMTNLIASHQVTMIFGGDDAEQHAGARGPGGWDFYNSAFLFDQTGHYAATYRKRQLVIFGEYVPLARWLPFTKYLTPIEAGFTPGLGPGAFRLSQPEANVSPLICFEDAFPHLARESVEPDTDFLLNLTNNGWFGESAAQWQHAVNALFRAVENGLPLVRCANNGLTCWVDPQGRLHDAGFDNARDIYAAGFKTVVVPLPPLGQWPAPTFYRRHGDWFAWGCVLWTLLAMAVTRRRIESAPSLSGRSRTQSPSDTRSPGSPG